MTPIDTDRFRVPPNSLVSLDDWDPATDDDLPKRKRKARMRELNGELEDLQELLYAEGKHSLLLVLQATDTGGKDGTIRHVFDGTNPQGVKVVSFKKPTAGELAHDYLWRVHQHTPSRGEITIFNRSHYEEVLVVRVHGLVPEQQWMRRYGQINDFERLLADEGTTIVKIFLHISKDEQKRRLQDRLDRPDKHWKFSAADLAERERWDDYQEAFRVMLEQTSTDYAPWYVVPANHKKYRNLVISKILVETLRGLDMSYPEAEEGLDRIIID
ncbi:MAG: polyphosphate kinase 2 family protein [Acidimicrobiales bacterium]